MPVTTFKPKTEEQKVTRTIMDTILVTPAIVKKWQAPPFQRPVKENAKVMALAEQMKADTGVWPGVVTLGVFNKETYIIDGQHRRAAFLIAKLEEGFVDVRIHEIKSFAEMGDEFVKLNSQLVKMGPDDILRGLEPQLVTLQTIRKLCPYVGYDSVRRGENTPMVSMSVAIRCWRGSSQEVPSKPTGSALTVAMTLLHEDVGNLCEYLHLAMNAWGHDQAYYRMWGTLNLTLTMWLYRHLVLEEKRVKRATRFTKELFQKCLMALSADAVYLDWLQGRQLGERDRAPAYTRIKALFSYRAGQELGQKVLMPDASWVTH
jgi:hypothetical protein